METDDQYIKEVKEKKTQNKILTICVLFFIAAPICAIIACVTIFKPNLGDASLYVYCGIIFAIIIIAVIFMLFKSSNLKSTKELINQYEPTWIIDNETNINFEKDTDKIIHKKYDPYSFKIQEPLMHYNTILNIKTESIQFTNYKAEYWYGHLTELAGTFNVTHLPYLDGPTLFFYNKKVNLEYLAPDEHTEITVIDNWINEKFDILYAQSKDKKENYKTETLEFIKKLYKINNNYSVLLLYSNSRI